MANSSVISRSSDDRTRTCGPVINSRVSVETKRVSEVRKRRPLWRISDGNEQSRAAGNMPVNDGQKRSIAIVLPNIVRAAIGLALLVCGCSGAAVAAHRDASALAPARPFCVYDTTAPTTTSGAVSYDSRAPGVDCVPPELGGVFSLGFAADGWWLQFDAPRYAVKVGDAQPIAFSAASLLAVQGEASCFEWTGDYEVVSDLPAWSIFIEATCKASGLRVVGQWSAPRN